MWSRVTNVSILLASALVIQFNLGYWVKCIKSWFNKIIIITNHFWFCFFVPELSFRCIPNANLSLTERWLHKYGGVTDTKTEEFIWLVMADGLQPLNRDYNYIKLLVLFFPLQMTAGFLYQVLAINSYKYIYI